MDWDTLGREAVELLARYLRIDTTNPSGNEIAGARFLADVLAADGVASEIAESEPGRANLYARLRGSPSLPGIVLHHHIDVVYADPRYWTVDPFAGVVRDGFVYGRGALDMKGLGIVQLVAVLALKRARVHLARDVVFLATADEEAGSRHGARFVESARRSWLDGAGYALSETGLIETRPGLRAPVGQIVVGERTGLPLRLTAHGEPGHGSMPWPETAPNRLVCALSRLSPPSGHCAWPPKCRSSGVSTEACSLATPAGGTRTSPPRSGIRPSAPASWPTVTQRPPCARPSR